MRVLVKTKDLPREEWLEWRRKGIGGSDAATLAGLNPWSSLYGLCLDKRGLSEEKPDNEAMFWGRTLEPVIAQEFTKRTGKKLRRRNAMLQHDQHDWALASVDRVVVGEKAGWEGKTTGQRESEQLFQYYECQCQWYLFVTGYNRWYLSVLYHGQKQADYTFKRNQAFIDRMEQSGREFWDIVQSGKMPPPDCSENCTKLLNDLYPQAVKDKIELPEEAYEKLQEYDELYEKSKEIEKALNGIKNYIKAEMKDHERAFVFDRAIGWTNVSRHGFDEKTFKVDHPDLHGKYMKDTVYRRFQVK